MSEGSHTKEKAIVLRACSLPSVQVCANASHTIRSFIVRGAKDEEFFFTFSASPDAVHTSMKRAYDSVGAVAQLVRRWAVSYFLRVHEEHS